MWVMHFLFQSTTTLSTCYRLLKKVLPVIENSLQSLLLPLQPANPLEATEYPLQRKAITK